jgi:hypothetical protein
MTADETITRIAETGTAKPEIQVALCLGGYIERRFCACGQEIYGAERMNAHGYTMFNCGDCLSFNGPRDAEPLDRRIRDAQPEVDEHAFDRPWFTWP